MIRPIAFSAALLMAAPAFATPDINEVTGYVNGAAAAAACLIEKGADKNVMQQHVYKQAYKEYGLTVSQTKTYLDQSLIMRMITFFGGCDTMIEKMKTGKSLL